MPCGVWKTTDIPENKVDGVVAGYQLDGPQSVVTTQQPDGNWTVTATFAPCARARRTRSAVFSE